MSQANVDKVRRGYAAIAAGDLEPIAELLAPDISWHGGDPEAELACHSRGEALAFMQARQGRQRIGELLDVIDMGDQVVVVMQPPPEDDVSPPPRANVTTFRDGQVVEMIGFESPEAAVAHVKATR